MPLAINIWVQRGYQRFGSRQENRGDAEKQNQGDEELGI